MYDYDLLVIGAGSGGLSAAKTAASYGARVAIADPGPLGGTCVNRGCIPKKLMVYAAKYAREQKLAKNYGWVSSMGEFDWLSLKASIEQELLNLRESYHSTLTKAGITLLNWQAQFADEHTLMVGDRTVTAENVVLAVGAKPTKPDLPGIEYGLTSRDIFHMESLPQQLTIVGGGYIGAEFSNIFTVLGCQVNLIEKHSLVLEGFDCSIRETLCNNLTEQGVRLMPNTALKAIEKTSKGFKLTLSGDCQDTLIADMLLLALGRKPNVEELNLSAAGVEVESGAISVDEYSRTSQPHIFAIGDCTNRIPLTPVAKAEGAAAVHTLFSDRPRKIDYRWVPSAVFCMPEAATVGWTDTEAQDHGISTDVHFARFTPLHYAPAPQKQKAMIKLVVNDQSGEIVGMHIVCDHAAEILQGFIPALRKGLTLTELTDTIGIHPTSGEEFFAIE